MKKKPHPRSCHKCSHLSSECDGNFVEFAVSWPACDMVDRYQYLKSFPFKKRMPCFNYHINVDFYKCLETELYAGGVWTMRDSERIKHLESIGEVYR